MRKTLYLLPILLLLNSCGDPKVVKVEVDFLLPGNTTLSKDDFVALVEPTATVQDKDEIILVSYPLSVYRLDTDRKIKLDYLSNKAVNYEKVSPIKRDFKKYFESSSFDSLFTSGRSDNADFTSYLTMPNCFLFSEKPETGNKLDGKKIFHEAGELKTEIASFNKNTKGKVFILYYPFNSAASKAEKEPVVENKTNETKAEPIPQKTKPVVNTGTGAAVQVTASSLEEYFEKLADAEIPYESKKGLKAGVLSYFADNAVVVKVNNNMETLAGGMNSVSGYAENLCSTHRKITIVDKQYSGTKISKLKVREQ